MFLSFEAMMLVNNHSSSRSNGTGCLYCFSSVFFVFLQVVGSISFIMLCFLVDLYVIVAYLFIYMVFLLSLSETAGHLWKLRRIDRET
ncbi:hypothetical protein Hanom_Chr15g01393931 [Helianthus anomalus]